MIKTFIKHHIYEKCIEVIFEGIQKAFVKPNIEYEILHFRNEGNKDGYTKMTMTYLHKGKRCDLTLSIPSRLIHEMSKHHGKSIEELNEFFRDMAMEEVAREIRIRNVGAKKYFEEEFGIILPNGVEDDDYVSDIAEVDVQEDQVHEMLNDMAIP